MESVGAALEDHIDEAEIGVGEEACDTVVVAGEIAVPMMDALALVAVEAAVAKES